MNFSDRSSRELVKVSFPAPDSKDMPVTRRQTAASTASAVDPNIVSSSEEESTESEGTDVESSDGERGIGRKEGSVDRSAYLSVYDENDDRSSKNYSLCADQSDMEAQNEMEQEAIEENDMPPFSTPEIPRANQLADDRLEILEENAAKFFNKKPEKSIKRSKKGRGKKKAHEKNANSSSDDENDLKGADWNLKIPVEEARDALRDADLHEKKLSARLNAKYAENFARWMFYLSQKFNVLLYGLGSKSGLLDDFCDLQLNDEYSHFVMKGYDSNFRLKEALVCLARELGAVVAKLNSVAEIGRAIEKHCSSKNDFDVILVIYNIDGPNLRDTESQLALSWLAQAPNIRLIASVDHVNTSLMWDDEMLGHFRFRRLHCPTYLSYAREIFAANQSVALALNKNRRTRAHTPSSLRSVWASLNDNARRIFRSLALRQQAISAASTGQARRKQRARAQGLQEELTESDDDTPVNPVAHLPSAHSTTFWDLYELARDDFLVSSEAALRQLLIEFDDHSLISRKTSTDGAEVIQIAIEADLLCEFFNEIDAEL